MANYSSPVEPKQLRAKRKNAGASGSGRNAAQVGFDYENKRLKCIVDLVYKNKQ